MLFLPDCSTVIQDAPRLVASAPRCSQLHLKATVSVQSTLKFDHPGILVRQLSDTPRGSQWHTYILLMYILLMEYGIKSPIELVPRSQLLVTGVLNPNNQYNNYWILSTTTYLFLFLSLSYPKTQPLVPLVQELPKLNLLQLPSPIYRKIKLSLRATTLRPTPRMVTRQCSDTSTPGNQYSRVRKNKKPLGRCGLNVLLPTDTVDFGMTWQPVAEHIRILSSIDQIYVAWSRRCMRVEMVIKFDR